MQISDSKITKTVFARFSEGEDLIKAIEITAIQNNVNAGVFLLIGTLKNAVLGFYKDRRYIPIRKTGPLEIASCSGNISIKDAGELVVHGHIVVSDSEGVAYGGHVMEGCIVAATVELILHVVESGKLERKFDETMNLWLWNK
ncbi:MAG: DUF296 domain-containing protein [Candidatus Bathyarchaeota archaeon]|nr:MAG: DUF296 domain-containing protein [Candidatus Bathyarchaeota archaeon]